jgi:hypothetical protein
MSIHPPPSRTHTYAQKARQARRSRRSRSGHRAGKALDLVESFLFSACHTRCGFHPESLPPTITTIRHGLGSVGDIIAAQVKEAMLGRQQLDLPQQRVSLAKEEAKADVLTGRRVHELAQKRLAEREKEANFYQLALPGLEDERQQFQDDTEWLRRKLDYLRGDLDNESEHI